MGLLSMLWDSTISSTLGRCCWIILSQLVSNLWGLNSDQNPSIKVLCKGALYQEQLLMVHYFWNCYSTFLVEFDGECFDCHLKLVFWTILNWVIFLRLKSSSNTFLWIICTTEGLCIIHRNPTWDRWMRPSALCITDLFQNKSVAYF